jgi:hypothetical protein
VSDWLDDFEMMGAKLNEGEKTLMRFAMSKERQRIINLLKESDSVCNEWAIALIEDKVSA